MPEAVSAPATAGHDEKIVLERAARPRLNDLFQVAPHERDDPYAVGCDRGLHGAGYGSANERVDTQLDQANSFPYPRIARKHSWASPTNTPDSTSTRRICRAKSKTERFGGSRLQGRLHLLSPFSGWLD
jgi:hypothetical protein